MRRMMLFVTVALVAAAMIAAGAIPTFAKQAQTKGEGRGVGASACLVPFDHDTIQSAVDDTRCQTIQLGTSGSFFYEESVTIDRNLTITGSGASIPAIVSGSQLNKTVFTILPGNSVTFEAFHIESGGGAGVGQGGDILNQGTLVLDGMVVRNGSATDGGGIYNGGTLTIDGGEVFRNTASDDGGGIYNAGTLRLNGGASVDSNVASGDGGGIYNAGTLYLCSATIDENEAPPGTEDDISGTPAKPCPPDPPGGPQKEKRVLVEHQGNKELCLPQAALKAHLKHGDVVIDEQGCSGEPAVKMDKKK